MNVVPVVSHRAIQVPWNKGRLIGPKALLKEKNIWAIQIRLQISKQTRGGLIQPPIDSKLRGCDLVRLRASDIANG